MSLGWLQRSIILTFWIEQKHQHIFQPIQPHLTLSLALTWFSTMWCKPPDPGHMVGKEGPLMLILAVTTLDYLLKNHHKYLISWVHPLGSLIFFLGLQQLQPSKFFFLTQSGMTVNTESLIFHNIFYRLVSTFYLFMTSYQSPLDSKSG